VAGVAADGGRKASASRAEPVGSPVLPLVIIAACAALVVISGLVYVLTGGNAVHGSVEEVAVRAERPVQSPVKAPKREPEPAAEPSPKPPSAAPPPPTSQTPTSTPPTPHQKWQAFQAERAKPGGRYPLESLDGEKAEAHRAKICEVGDVEFDLLLPTMAFGPGIDVWRLACSRPDKAKREWVFACESGPQGQPYAKKTYPLGAARVEDDGWLVVALDARSDFPSVRAAREALTCGPLTLETPLTPNGAPDQRQTFVQLRRPVEYGPLRIKHFFANKAIWPRGNPRQGNKQAKWLPGEFVPIPGVPVQANPWFFRMTAGKNDVVLVGDGMHMPQATDVIIQDGDFSGVGAGRPFGVQIIWCGTFSKEPVPVRFIRTDVQFRRVAERTAEVLGVRIGDARDDENFTMQYDLLGHLNKAAAFVHRDRLSEPMPVREFFPITKKVVEDFRKSQLKGVGKVSISSFIQAWLPRDKYRTPESRTQAVSIAWKYLPVPEVSPLDEWPDKLRDAIAAGDLYKEWCNNSPLGNPPGPPPADPKQRENWQKQKSAWEAAKAAFDNRLKANRMKMAEFATWLGSRQRPPDARPEYDDVIAVLQAVCTAIEKLPAVAQSKQEVFELLESMQTADLEITGDLVVWPPNEYTKQCVLATFTKGKAPVVAGGDLDTRWTAGSPDTPPPNP
jgi:hypothetical protein